MDSDRSLNGFTMVGGPGRSRATHPVASGPGRSEITAPAVGGFGRPQGAPLRVGFVSSFPPRRCGIASFTADLAAALRRASQPVRAVAVAVDPGWEVLVRSRPYPGDVEDVYPMVRERREEYPGAAAWLARRGCHVVSLQHEYGVYGGPYGRWVVDFAEALRVPLVTTLHTVLRHPTPDQRAILVRLAQCSRLVVVLARSAVELLERVYGVEASRVVVIPHGTPAFRRVDPARARQALGLGDRPVLLTYGLLSPGKGIEQAIAALVPVARRYPDVLYLVAGQTHPNVRQRMGEAYRERLMQMAAELGVASNLRFVDRYLELEELAELLAAADVYVTPYPNEEQVVSGTLSYALAAGKAVVSTPFRYAREVLGRDRGLLCRFGDAQSMAREILRLLDSPELRRTLERRAFAFGQSMNWEIVAERYVRVFARAQAGGMGLVHPQERQVVGMGAGPASRALPAWGRVP